MLRSLSSDVEIVVSLLDLPRSDPVHRHGVGFEDCFQTSLEMLKARSGLWDALGDVGFLQEGKRSIPCGRDFSTCLFRQGAKICQDA